MRYSIGAGPIRVYGGHEKQQRPKPPLTPKQLLGAFIVWLMLCTSGIIWLGIETQSAPAVIGAIVGVLFVLFKIVASLGQPQ